MNTLSDGANGGTEGFYFLPPMVKSPDYSGVFDGSLSPVVEICTTTACSDIHATFSMTEGTGSELVRLEETDEHYIVNWHTGKTGAVAGQTYRIRVSLAGTVLGYANVAVVSTGREAVAVRSDGSIALVANQTLPVKFRIEEGTVFVIGSDGGTFTSDDGAVTLQVPQGAVEGDIGIIIKTVTEILDDLDVIPGLAFEFLPSPYTFAKPVILTVLYDPSGLPSGISADELRLLAFVGDEWVQLPGSSVDVVNSTVSGPLDSFSRKAVGRGKIHAISVTPADASIGVGETQQFEATVTNVDGEVMSRNVQWSSSDNAVATIDRDGLATGVALGEATIEAKSGKVSGSVALTVETLGPVVHRIEVSPATATIDVGATQQFTATVYDQNDEVMEDETVIWSSGDSGITSVDAAGLATGISEGETTIIASIGEVSGSANLVVAAADVSSAFVTKWDTNKSSGTTIAFILNGVVDATIDWGDGTISRVTSPGTRLRTYATEGIYLVSITGNVDHYRSYTPFFGASERDKLVEVVDWGDVGFKSLSFAFTQNVNLVAVPSTFDGLESVTDMSFMFYAASSFNSDISAWNTANIINMEGMFANARAFNQPIGAWNTTNVTNMQSMFSWAINFNQYIGDWDTRNVTSMRAMFGGAALFDQDISSWDVSNVTDMEWMFNTARAFNQNIGDWNTAQVTNMSNMFELATSFNYDISRWDVSKVTNMRFMFFLAVLFNQNIGSWNTSNVEFMSGMFRQAFAFDGDIGGWDTGKVTDMGNMFMEAGAFNQDIGSWDTGKVTSMDMMFDRASSFNQDIGSWNTANVIHMQTMFRHAAAFNRDLSRWCVSNFMGKPIEFDTGATSWLLPRPVWGTCPI